MKQVLGVALEVQEFCDLNRWEFCFIGGISLQRWAIPRNTNDVDITLMTGFGDEEVFVTRLLERFTSRIETDALEFFVPRRIVLIQSGNVGIDVSLGALEFEQCAVARSTKFEFAPGIVLRTCSAEDLVVFKAFADRLKDWADIESVLKVQESLDWTYIEEQLVPLVELKEEPEIISRLNRIRKSNYK